MQSTVWGGGYRRNTLPLPSPRADCTRADDSERISPPPITHHTMHKKTRTLQQNHVCQWGTHSYRVGSLSRLASRPPFEPSLTKDVLPLIIAPNGSNGAISLTQTFKRIIFICSLNGCYFRVQKEKNGDRGTIVITAVLKKLFVCAVASQRLPPKNRLLSIYNSSTHFLRFQRENTVVVVYSCL